MSKKQNSHRGSSFEDFLREDGIYEEVTAKAIKRIVAWKISQEMKAQKISKTVLAKRMHTSRAQLDRLLDPDSATLTLQMLTRAADGLGKTVKIELVDA